VEEEMMTVRCPWPGDDPLMVEYHDREWGVPVHDDRKLFEFMLLDAAQAGLSWKTILHRREGYRAAFSDFDPVRVAAYTDEDVGRLLQDSRIIRNRLKIVSSVENARRFLQVQREFGSFDPYIWGFVGGKPIHNRFENLADIPSSTVESETMSLDLRKRGFRFVGPTICYAFMQAAGLVNDHITSCFRHAELMRVQGQV
jgi:DNA-3-methyladenine glycosylase I